MTANQMLCYCADPVRLALACLPLRSLPTPRDMRQDDASRSTAPTTFAQDKALLLQALADFVTRPAAAPLAPHPGYGPLNRAQWGRFIYLPAPRPPSAAVRGLYFPRAKAC